MATLWEADTPDVRWSAYMCGLNRSKKLNMGGRTFPSAVRGLLGRRLREWRKQGGIVCLIGTKGASRVYALMSNNDRPGPERIEHIIGIV